MDKKFIYIFKGDDTNWNNEQFLTVNVTSDTADLSTMTAKFILGSYTEEYPLTTGSFQIDLNAATTGDFAFGPICGVIQILDSEGRIKTACNTIPFFVTDKVITEQAEEINVPLPEGSPVNIDLFVGENLDYNSLRNLPTLNGVTIQGDKTSVDYGLANSSDIVNLQEQIDGKQPVGDYATHTDLSQGLATKQDKLNSSQLAAVNSGIDSSKTAQIATNATEINSIQSKIPSQASASNQLADKNFVNSSIATNTANFLGTFNSVQELPSTATNNDYAFVISTDTAGNVVYNRYKYNGTQWLFEYALNNSSFTANQWAAINSGATSTNIAQIATNTSNIAALQTEKQDILTAGRYIKIVDGGTPSPLPSGCAQVEYITATGTQHLDTLITATQDYEIRAKLRLTELNDSFLYGARQAYGNSSFALHRNYAAFSTDAGGGYVNLGVNAWYNIKQNKNGIYISDAIAHSYSSSLPSFTTPNTIRVFAMAQGNHELYGTSFMKGDCAEFEIYNNGNLVCKLVPCIDANNVVCMYDTVNERFLYNQGTGLFTAGAVVAGSDTINCTIEDTDIITILGYTPVNPSSLATVATTGSYNDLSDKPSVGNGTITINQGGVQKGTFTTNQSSDTTINLDAGGGSGTWGNITGTLSDQTDLQSALNDKQNKLFPGSNIQINDLGYICTISATDTKYTAGTGIEITAENVINLDTIDGGNANA